MIEWINSTFSFPEIPRNILNNLQTEKEINLHIDIESSDKKMNLDYKIDNNRFNARVSAIIYNKDKTQILLFKMRDRDFYMLPGGRIEMNEDSLSAVKEKSQKNLVLI